MKQAQDSATYHLIVSELQRIGYRVMEIVLDGSDAGTLEDRARYYFVAVSEGVADSFTLDDLPKCEKVYQTMGDIMEEVPADDPSWKAYDYLEKKAVSDALAGKGFKRQFIDQKSTSVGTTGKGYFKARSTEAFWKRSDGLQRLMTVAEHAAVKLIPFKLVEGLAPSTAHEGLGQSVLLPHVTSLMDRVCLGIRSLQPA